MRASGGRKERSSPLSDYLTGRNRPAAINRAIWRGLTIRPKKGSSSARILVADGDHRSREAIRKLLADEGHEVDTASDGAEALDATTWAPKDLVITAISLPVSSGLDLIRDLRLRFPGLKIIALAGDDEPEGIVEAARAAGAQRVLIKPIEAERLIACVREVVGERT